MTYDDKRDKATITDPRGYTTSTAYSVTHKLLTTTLPDGSVITNHYNKDDRLDWTIDPLGKTTTLGLDAVGRTTSLTDPLSRVTTTTYQDDLRLTTVQAPGSFDIKTKLTVDDCGQVVRNEDGLGNYAVPGYDKNGNKTSWIDRRGKTWQFTYDKENRLKNTKSPLNRNIAQTWNARGLLDTVTEPSTQVTEFTYDARKRLTQREDGVGTVAYGLDDAGQLLTVTQGSEVLTRTYHDSGEVKTYTNANNETISYGYDKSGNLSSLTYPALGTLPSVTVTMAYDSRNRLTRVTDWNNKRTTYTWDAAGKLSLVTRPNGTKRRMSFDSAGQVLAIEERPSIGAPLLVRSFHFDPLGRIDRKLTYPQATPWDEPAWTATYNDDNRMITVTGGTLSYDSDGNLLGGPLPDGPWGSAGSSTGATGTFTWNARNQMTTATRTGGQNAAYTYDAEGNLIKTVDSVAGPTRWIIDPHGGGGSRVLAKIAPNGDVTRYVYGAGLVYEVRQNGDVRYYHYDQCGSTVALTDENGTVKGRADYTPYGGIQSTSGELANANKTPFLFVGAYGVLTDQVTGLHNMRARWYSDQLRRFMSEDPAGFAGDENSYAYANGNPLMFIDPLGLFGWRDGVSIGIGVLPFVGTAQSAVELISGKDYITGEPANRWLAAAGLVAGAVPAGKSLLKGGTKVFSKGAAKGVRDADEMVTIYRGVHAEHPGLTQALEGRATPWGGHADAALHNAGDNKSVFTSWTTDQATAIRFATEQGAGGVLLRQTVPRSSLINSPDLFKEFEVLRLGPIDGATPIILSR